MKETNTVFDLVTYLLHTHRFTTSFLLVVRYTQFYSLDVPQIFGVRYTDADQRCWPRPLVFDRCMFFKTKLGSGVGS